MTNSPFPRGGERAFSGEKAPKLILRLIVRWRGVDCECFYATMNVDFVRNPESP